MGVYGRQTMVDLNDDAMVTTNEIGSVAASSI